MLRRLSAVTQGRRRQRAATTAGARDFEDEQSSARIGRALFIILLIHLLAVAMIFVHHRFLDGRSPKQAAATKTQTVVEPAAPVVQPQQDAGVVRSQMSPDETPYIVRNGDNYASIAKAHQVAEADLRELNNNINIRPGYIMKIPVKRVVIRTPREEQPVPVVHVETAAAASPMTQQVPARDHGLVEAVDTRSAPRAVAVAAGEANAGSYVVQKGDSIWGIATRHGVDQQKLMEANGIHDPRKLRAGMTLRIP